MTIRSLIEVARIIPTIVKMYKLSFAINVITLIVITYIYYDMPITPCVAEWKITILDEHRKLDKHELEELKAKMQSLERQILQGLASVKNYETIYDYALLPMSYDYRQVMYGQSTSEVFISINNIKKLNVFESLCQSANNVNHEKFCLHSIDHTTSIGFIGHTTINPTIIPFLNITVINFKYYTPGQNRYCDIKNVLSMFPNARELHFHNCEVNAYNIKDYVRPFKIILTDQSKFTHGMGILKEISTLKNIIIDGKEVDLKEIN